MSELPGTKLIQLEKDKDLILVRFHNNALLGTMSIAEDGYYVFWPKQSGGFWAAEVMRDIVTILDQLNEAWHKEVMEGCL